VKKTVQILFFCLLVPLMLFSYSGIKLRTHICQTTGKIAIQTGTTKAGGIKDGCSCEHNEAQCCSSGSHDEGSTSGIHKESSCCYDLVVQVKTDDHLPVLKDSYPALYLIQTQSPHIKAEARHSTWNFVSHYYYPPPPKPELISVFRL